MVITLLSVEYIITQCFNQLVHMYVSCMYTFFYQNRNVMTF